VHSINKDGRHSLGERPPFSKEENHLTDVSPCCYARLSRPIHTSYSELADECFPSAKLGQIEYVS
jgi:hypothetical protein